MAPAIQRCVFATEGTQILRLTRVSQDRSGITLRVEGGVFGEWVALLERECAAAAREFGVVDLDLAAVTYVDTMGIAALRGLVRNRVTITNCAPLIRELLGEDGKP